MIEHLIEKSERVKELEAWDDFLEFTLDRTSRELIARLGIVSIMREARTRGRYTMNMTHITPTRRRFDIVTGEEIK